MRACGNSRSDLPADVERGQGRDGDERQRAAAAAHLVELARARGGQIIVPTGALLGFDAVIAAAEGTISSVQITTRKPPAGLAGAPYLIENGISVDGLNSALRVFKGTGRDAAAAFPANVNVVAALSLAGSDPIAHLSKSGPIRQ